MTNKELFENYGTETWVIEQTLHFMLQEFVDACGHRMSEVPFNTVAFIKKFMQKETISDLHFAEISKLETLESNIIDVIDPMDV